MKKLGLISLALLTALLLAVSAFAATKTLTVSMTGKAETPKGDPDGKGTAKVTLNTSTGRVCFKLTWSGIGNPVAAHIHKGKKGVAGPVVIPFFGAAAKHTGCVKASKSLVGKIAKTPAAYYVNVHTQAFPGGAIRAQL
ncbi:MAG TPA: CHRD domain-containing protein [Thermoleophilaceae bacterium]